MAIVLAPHPSQQQNLRPILIEGRGGEETVSACGVVSQIDNNRRVVEFAEKPKNEALKKMQVDTTVLGLNKEEAKLKPYIASMGIYVFKKGVLGRYDSVQLW